MTTALLIVIYVAFISLGLPDALLGAGWPAMQPGFGVAYGLAGVLQMIISAGTIVFEHVLRQSSPALRHGPGRRLQRGDDRRCIAGFRPLSRLSGGSCRRRFPLGLGAGAVDAALNAFVAERYESRHMSWLHSFWGVGALAGPLVLSFFLGRGASWRNGYLSIAALQCVLVVALIAAIPMWAKVRSRGIGDGSPTSSPHPSLMDQLRLPGVKLALTVFLLYCGIELSMGLWGGSYLVKVKGLGAAEAAFWVSAYYASLTLGRFVTGFVTFRVRNVDLIRWGGATMLMGVLLILAPLPLPVTLAGVCARWPRVRADLPVHASRNARSLWQRSRAVDNGDSDGLRLHRLHLPAARVRLRLLLHIARAAAFPSCSAAPSWC